MRAHQRQLPVDVVGQRANIFAAALHFFQISNTDDLFHLFLNFSWRRLGKAPLIVQKWRRSAEPRYSYFLKGE